MLTQVWIQYWIQSLSLVLDHLLYSQQTCITEKSKTGKNDPIYWRSRIFSNVLCLYKHCYVRQLVSEFMDGPIHPSKLYSNSTSSISTTTQLNFTRNEYYRLETHNVRELKLNNELIWLHIRSNLNPANILTKILPRPAVQRHCGMLFPNTKKRYRDDDYFQRLFSCEEIFMPMLWQLILTKTFSLQRVFYANTLTTNTDKCFFSAKSFYAASCCKFLILSKFLVEFFSHSNFFFF